MAVKIALDCGHGLNTAGKQTPTGIKEWILNDKVRDKIVKLLSDYDVEFIFTDNNEGQVDEPLGDRVAMYKKKGAKAVVSIHHNAHRGVWGTATGVEVHIDKNATAADIELANLIIARLPGYMGLRNRGIWRNDWWVINQNEIPAVLVEGGFMDTKKDYDIITSDEGQNGYAKAVAEALIEFLDLKKKKTATNKNTAIMPKAPFEVKLLETRNIRKGAGTKYKVVKQVKAGVYTITQTKINGSNTWGKLKSGDGWILIKDEFCTVLESVAKADSVPFKVKTLTTMNVRKDAGTKYKVVSTAGIGVYTISKTKKAANGTLWGKLKSGAGWICIEENYCKRV